MAKPTGYVVYQGPSRFDGQPIVGIVTLESDNVKTGNMAQLWILRADEAPHHACRTGADVSVCGTCPHRGTIDEHGKNSDRTCYVITFQGPLAVWNKFKRGGYPSLSPNACGAMLDTLRLGAYGDPAALPVDVVAGLSCKARKVTGYSHAWLTFSDVGGRCMASVDTVDEARQATARGMRYFRVSPDNSVLPGEIVCPASDEAGNRTTCEQCALCDGSKGPGDRRKNIVILAHGAGAGKIAARFAGQ